jgi:hypothetical protein
MSVTVDIVPLLSPLTTRLQDFPDPEPLGLWHEVPTTVDFPTQHRVRIHSMNNVVARLFGEIKRKRSIDGVWH